MRVKIIMALVGLSVLCAVGARAQEAGSEQRVTLESQAIALDSAGRPALAGQLLTRALRGAPDAPVKNVRFIVENRSQSFYTYVTGSATFYDERGVRCGEGQFSLNALAVGEQAETDAPGLRLTCEPRTWRIVAINLLTRTGDTAKPAAEETATTVATPEPPAAPAIPPLEVVVDDKVYDAPLGATLNIPVRTRRVKITVRPAQ